MQAPASVPRLRLSVRNDAPLRPGGAYVLVWMTAARRTTWNFTLDRAAALAREHGRGVLVLEALRAGHEHASGRLHRFVLDGMRDNAARCAAHGVAYHAYVEPRPGDGKGLLAALADRAVAVVTDEYPTYFLPRMLDAAARSLSVRLEAVDGNGLLPLRALDAAPSTAFLFRRALQASLLRHLDAQPSADPLASLDGLPRAEIPADVLRRWPAADAELLAHADVTAASLASFPIDHDVRPVACRGGAAEGARVLDAFVGARLGAYPEARDHPDDDDGASGLSPWLHFGHVGAHQAFARVADAEGWRPAEPPRVRKGAREGWWRMSAAAEAFLDQLVTWRELSCQWAFHREDHRELSSIPAWARATLAKHRDDVRRWTYTAEEFEAARTHDAVWNAAQRQLRAEGRIHNRVRMLWGKKVLEWSRTPEEALATLVRLNDRWAVDGRDPNSYAGILWCFGRHDRAWGPERPVIGTVRYMSTDLAPRKHRMNEWLRRWSGARD